VGVSGDVCMVVYFPLASINVPQVSAMSSTMMAVLPFTSPTKTIRSTSFAFLRCRCVCVCGVRSVCACVQSGSLLLLLLYERRILETKVQSCTHLFVDEGKPNIQTVCNGSHPEGGTNSCHLTHISCDRQKT